MTCLSSIYKSNLKQRVANQSKINQKNAEQCANVLIFILKIFFLIMQVYLLYSDGYRNSEIHDGSLLGTDDGCFQCDA